MARSALNLQPPTHPPSHLQLYKPLEFLFLVAAFTTLAENFLPQLMSLPKSIVQTVRGTSTGGMVGALGART